MKHREWLWGLSLLFLFLSIRLGDARFLLLAASSLLFPSLLGRYRKKMEDALALSLHLEKNRLFPGESLKGEIRLENRTPYPLGEVQLSFPLRRGINLTGGPLWGEGKGGGNISMVYGRFSLLPYERIRIPFTLSAEKRGAYRFLQFDLRYGDPFGLLSWSKSLSSDEALLVYPEEGPVETGSSLIKAPLGDRTVMRFILPDPFLHAGSRPYRAGDSFANVDQKKSARFQSIYTKTFEHTSHAEFILMVNLSSGHQAFGFDEGRFETLLSYAAFFSRLSAGKGWSFQLVMNAKAGKGDSFFLKPRPGRGAHRQVLEFLAGLTPLSPTPFLKSLSEVRKRGSNGALLLLITAYVDAGMEDQLRRMTREGFTIYLLPVGEGPGKVVPWKNEGYKDGVLSKVGGG